MERTLEQRREAVDQFKEAVIALKDNAERKGTDNIWIPYSERQIELKQLAIQYLLGIFEEVSPAELVAFEMGLLGTDKAMELCQARLNYYSPDEMRTH